MQRVAGPGVRTQAPAPASAPSQARGQASRWIRRLEPKTSIFLGIRPVEGIGRDVRDALLEYEDPQEAATFVFGASPASTLSQEWRIIVVSDGTAHCYEIDGGATLIPVQAQSWRALRRHDLAWRYPRIGYTVDSIEEITKKAIRISWPMKYSTYSENSQKFAYLLFEAIRQPNEPPTISDILSGLDRIPGPLNTLSHRCQAAILMVIVALHKRVVSAIDRRLWAPIKSVLWYGTRAKDVLASCLILALYALRVYILLLQMVFFLAWDRDLMKASQELRDIAADVRRFDGYERPVKDSAKTV